jgi:enoyl-CoA hydratase
VLLIEIDRPNVRNAIDLATAHALASSMDRLDEDPDLMVAVLTGRGGTFSAGMDLKAFARGEVPIVDGRGFGGLVQRPPRKPLIAAVEGHALAGGFELVLACDLIVAGRSAVFGLPEVRRGLTPNGGGMLRLPRRLPFHVAMHAILTGDPIPAGVAAQHGLVTELVDDGEALPASLSLALRIAQNAPLAVATAKRVVIDSADWQSQDEFARQEPLVAPVRASQDAIEGAQAFAEKRAPNWQGI